MELAIVKFLNRFKLEIVDSFLEFINRTIFLFIFWTVVAFAFLLFDDAYGGKIFWGIIIAALLHFAVSEALLKHVLINFKGKRARPYLAHPNEIKPIGKPHKDSSFPSSHMASALAILAVILFFQPLFWPWALIFVIILAFFRMRSGMHYPTDVLAGAILGVIYGITAVKIIN